LYETLREDEALGDDTVVKMPESHYVFVGIACDTARAQRRGGSPQQLRGMQRVSRSVDASKHRKILRSGSVTPTSGAPCIAEQKNGA